MTDAGHALISTEHASLFYPMVMPPCIPEETYLYKSELPAAKIDEEEHFLVGLALLT